MNKKNKCGSHIVLKKNNINNKGVLFEKTFCVLKN